MRDAIRNLSDRGEFFVITTLSFAYFIATSLAVLLLRIHTFELTTWRVSRGIATELAILAVVWSILFLRGWRLHRLLGSFSWFALVAGVPLFVAYYLLYATTYAAVVSAFPTAARVSMIRIVPSAPFLLMFAFILLNSLFEEITVAGYVITALSKQGPAMAITASTLLRLLYHLYYGPIASIVILPFGLLFAAVYWRWRNLWPLLVAHSLANALAFAASGH